MTDHDLLVRHDAQIERMVSDIESEKRTRANVNSDFKKDLNDIREAQKRSDKILWSGLGAIWLLQIVVPFFHK